MRKKSGLVLMITGAALIAAALLLLVYNRAGDAKAGETASELVTELRQENGTETAVLPVREAAPAEMTVVEIDGYGYIGYLGIPALELELPVMSDWSYPQLKISPCRYLGTVSGGDLIIAGHNYNTHFGLLKTLRCGDAVTFTDMDGRCWQYEVSRIETLGKYDVEAMQAGDWDLTLYTCTVGGEQRVTVRCVLK